MNKNPAIWTRRNFLHCGLAAGSASALAGGIAPRLFAGPDESPAHQNARIGIGELRLQTNKMDEIQTFYSADLGLPTHRDGERLTVDAGSTRIVFAAVNVGEPFYHVAFNIPENKLDHARRWQKQRTELVRKGNAEVVHFSKWNADSVFFRDPAGNLLEYIARHNLDNRSDGQFSATDILYASEIGLVVDDVPKTVAAAKNELDFNIYRDNSASFASIGDEHALLIAVKRDRKWFPARQRPAKAFPLAATIRKPTARSLEMNEFDYKISTK